MLHSNVIAIDKWKFRLGATRAPTNKYRNPCGYTLWSKTKALSGRSSFKKHNITLSPWSSSSRFVNKGGRRFFLYNVCEQLRVGKVVVYFSTPVFDLVFIKRFQCPYPGRIGKVFWITFGVIFACFIILSAITFNLR